MRETYLRMIADWQKSTGISGAPPVKYSKKLSNWIQWARAEYKRERLDPGLARSLEGLGIRLCTRGESMGSAPRGIPDVTAAILRFIVARGRVPSLIADDKSERHLAVWLVRLQSGILPRNEFSCSTDDQQADARGTVATLFREAERVQSHGELAAAWWLFTTAVMVLLPLFTLGNRWQSAFVELQPDSVAMRLGSEAWRRYQAIARGDLPPPALLHPGGFASLLSSELEGAVDADRAVWFADPGESVFGMPLATRLEASGVRWADDHAWWQQLRQHYWANLERLDRMRDRA